MTRPAGPYVRRAVFALIAVSLLSSACTVSLFEDEQADAQHEDDGHDHGDAESTDDHDHGDDESAADGHEHSDGEGGADGETRIDHHGNPIYDEEERVYEEVTFEGVRVEFTVENFIGVGGRGGDLAPRLVEGEHATLQFHVTDAVTGQPLGGLRPAVWLDVADGVECSTRIERYLSGGLDTRPILDLNSYFILGMNRDNTISVIDPLVDVGGMTNLYSLILLPSTPQDWAMATDRSRLFVTMPDIEKVAVVDLEAFLAEDTVDLPGPPDRIRLQPGGDRVWVTLAEGGGFAVIDTETLQVETVTTAAATGALAFAADGATAVVGTVRGALLIDTSTLGELAHVALGATPSAVAISGSNGDAYLALPDSGDVAVLDVERGTRTAIVQVDPGVADIEVSGDGRWAIAVNPDAETAYVLDTTTDEITHVFPVEGVPDQVTFTSEAAYVHTSGSPSVTAVPLDRLEPSGEISVLTVPIGIAPSGSVGAPAVADAIMPTPDGAALLIANPADDVIHFYTEGSEAALGGFQGHTLQPRAVQVIDRSVKEPAPGVYTGSIRIPVGGDLIAAFLLDDPRLVHCFSFTARSSEEPLGDVTVPVARIELTSPGSPVEGEPYQLVFVLRETGSDAALSGVEDVVARVVQSGGSWSAELKATPTADGSYAAEFDPPSPGNYTLLVAAPSLGLGFQSLPPASLSVSAAS